MRKQLGSFIFLCLLALPALGQDRMFLDWAGSQQPAQQATTIGWTLDASASSKSNFKYFGGTASENPIGQVNLTVDFGAWDVTLIGVEGIGRHESGVDAIADYYDILLWRSWKNNRLSVWVGSEMFHAPPQLGGEQVSFLVPQGAVTYQNANVSWTFGVQVPLPIDTEYGGDAVFGWAEVTLKRSWGRLTASVTPGVVLGVTGRYTFYLGPKVKWKVRDALSLYVAGLTARSVEAGGSSSWIDPTPTIGFSTSF